MIKQLKCEEEEFPLLILLLHKCLCHWGQIRFIQTMKTCRVLSRAASNLNLAALKCASLKLSFDSATRISSKMELHKLFRLFWNMTKSYAERLLCVVCFRSLKREKRVKREARRSTVNICVLASFAGSWKARSLGLVKQQARDSTPCAVCFP